MKAFSSNFLKLSPRISPKNDFFGPRSNNNPRGGVNLLEKSLKLQGETGSFISENHDLDKGKSIAEKEVYNKQEEQLKKIHEAISANIQGGGGGGVETNLKSLAESVRGLVELAIENIQNKRQIDTIWWTGRESAMGNLRKGVGGIFNSQDSTKTRGFTNPLFNTSQLFKNNSSSSFLNNINGRYNPYSSYNQYDNYSGYNPYSSYTQYDNYSGYNPFFSRYGR